MADKMPTASELVKLALKLSEKNAHAKLEDLQTQLDELKQRLRIQEIQNAELKNTLSEVTKLISFQKNE